ncbi:MAG: YncE family protein, partial [Gammaproteobacteria bacterium]|nr:YncE family protein [Gammaproteobacteria bacterium]
TDEGHQRLLLLDLNIGKVIKTITLPSQGAHMVITDNEKRYAYVTNASGIICKIDLKTNTVINQVSIGNESEGITLTPDEEMILATNRKDNILAVLRASDLTILKKINVGLGPVRVATYHNGAFAVVTNSTGGTAQTIDLNNLYVSSVFRTTLSFNRKYGRKLGKFLPVPNSIFVRDDQMTAYITNMYAGNVTLVNLDKGTIEKTFEANRLPNGLAFSSLKVK